MYLLREGHSFMVTGEPGTGKSKLLCEMRRLCEAAGHRTYTVALSGLASENVRGFGTLHKWAGVQLAAEAAEVYAARIARQSLHERTARHRWTRGDVLFVDEVSMLSSALDDKLEEIGRTLRGRDDLPYGGLQIVLFGDFHQLPPVFKGDEGERYDDEDEEEYLARRYLFRSGVWRRAITRVVVLDVVFRQRDERLISFLRRARVGQLTPEDHALMVSRVRLGDDVRGPDGLLATWIFARKDDAAERNRRRLAQLPGRAFVTLRGETLVQTRAAAHMVETPLAGSDSWDDAREFVNSVSLEEEFHFKVGAEVLLTVAVPNTRLVNGSRGVIVGVGAKSPDAKAPPADAKAPPSDAKDARTAPDGAAAPSPSAGEADADLGLGEAPNEKVWVRFKTRDPADQPMDQLVMVERAERRYCLVPSEASRPEGEWTKFARVTQMPLMLSYALTMHKVQGQEYESVHVALDRSVFAPGQAYMAVSRVKTLEGLTLRGGYSPAAFKSDPQVSAWYAEQDALARAEVEVARRVAVLIGRAAARGSGSLRAATLASLMPVICEFAGRFVTDVARLAAATVAGARAESAATAA